MPSTAPAGYTWPLGIFGHSRGTNVGYVERLFLCWFIEYGYHLTYSPQQVTVMHTARLPPATFAWTRNRCKTQAIMVNPATLFASKWHLLIAFQSTTNQVPSTAHNTGPLGRTLRNGGPLFGPTSCLYPTWDPNSTSWSCTPGQTSSDGPTPSSPSRLLLA